MSPDPYLAHVLARLEADIAFLITQGHLSPSDAELIQRKLAGSKPTEGVSGLANRFSGMLRRESSASAASSAASTPPPPPPPPRAPTPAGPQAKAKWDYPANEDGDLALRKGDIVTILEETNADWWRARNARGEEGLVPSNRVEKLASTVPVFPPRAVPPPPPPVSYPNEKATYTPPSLASPAAEPAPEYTPPPLTGAGGTYWKQPPAGLSQPPPPAPGQPQEKSKWQKFGSKAGDSAVQGAGFGAGAAIGGGLVRAIF